MAGSLNQPKLHIQFTRRPIVVRLALSVAGRLFITTAICHVPYHINEEQVEGEESRAK